MSQNDYIILRDEDGKAYIAHAGLLDNARNTIRGVTNSISTTAQQVANKAKGVGRGVRQNHKYILKVFENGRTRYFYKQEEVKAYYEAKKRGVKNAAEYAQNAVKDKASDVADAAKNVVNKATGATANKTAEMAKKNADDASRWAKMTERVHKENVANFKQNPTEANLAKAKQSGQAVTRANQNEKNARKEADKAQDIADQHPANKAKSAFDQAKKSADNAVANAKNNYDRIKSEFRDKAKQADNAVRSTAKNAVDKAKDIAGYDEKERLDKANADAKKALKYMQNATSVEELNAALGVRGERFDAAEKARADYDKTPLGMIDNARSSTVKAVNEAWDRIPKNSDGTVNPFDKNFQSTYNDWKAKKDKYDSSLVGRAKDAAEKATDSVKDMIDQAKKAISSKPPTPTLSSPNNPIQTENIIRENVIEEQRTPERRINEQKIEERKLNEEKINERAYKKKPDPVNSSGARNFDTLKQDAKEAGIDFTAYSKASKELEQITRRLMKEYDERRNSPGIQPLYSPMFWEDPEYKEAVAKEEEEEEKLVKKLYY